MDSGYFFELRDESNVLDKQILFSYTGIKSNSKPKYPVFIVFNQERIDFFFHGQIQYKYNATLKKTVGAERGNFEFIETLLFSLNLHEGKENISKLNAFLRDLFDKKFPVLPQFIIHTEDDSISEKRGKHVTYAELEQFQVKEKKDNEGNVNNKLSYKTLFLDFLFDVYHSDLFYNCPVFTKIKHRLDEIPFIQAIKRKAEFYYQVTNNQIEEKLVTFDSTNSNYIDKLITAQGNWLEILQKEDSNKFINKGNRWFDDVETEVREVLKKQIINKIGTEENSMDELINQKTAASQWFIKRNNFIDAWKSSFDIYSWIIDFIQWGGIALFLFLLFEIANVILNIEGKIVIKRDISKEFLIYIILGSFIILIVISIVYLLFTFIKNKNPLTIRLKHLPFIIFRLALFPFLILFITSAFAISELTAFGNKYLIFHNGLYYQESLVTFLLLVITIVAFLKCLSYLVHYLKNIVIKPIHFKLRKPNAFIQIIFVVIVLVVLFVYSNIGLYTNAIEEINDILSNINSLYLDSLKVLTFPNFWYLIILSVVLLGFIFWIFFNDEKKSHPNLDMFTYLKKVFSMLLVGLIFSFFSNLLVLNYTYKDYLDKFSFVDELWNSARYPDESSFDTTVSFDTSNVSHEELEQIWTVLKMPVSPKRMAEKEECFYTPLENLKITKNGKALYPIVKKIDIHGIKIITMPAVLFINTFLTLLLAVLIQVVLNHKKFFEGGKA